jgi:MFS family permease
MDETVALPSTPSRAATGEAAGRLLAPERRALTLGLVLTVTMVGFEALAVATAMPIAREHLGALRLYGLVFTAYMLGNLLGIILAGQLADRRGPAAPFAAGTFLFATGLLIASVAPSMLALVVGRAVQGFGGGLMITAVWVGIGRGYPERLRARMFTLLSSAWVIPGVLGPALSGAVAEHLSWRLVFAGLLPLVALAGVLTLPGMRSLGPPAGPGAPGRITQAVRYAVGASMLASGLAIDSPPAAVVLVAGGAGIGLSALRDYLPAGTLRIKPGLPAAVAMMGIATLPFFGAETFLPLLLEDVRGQAPVIAGLSLTAASITWTLGSWLQERRGESWGRRRAVRLGLIMTIIGIGAILTAVWSQAPAVVAALGWGIGGLGMGIAYPSITLLVLASAPEGQEGAAASSMQISNVLGIVAGTGIGGALIAAGESAGWATSTGVALTFATMIAFAFIALLAAGRLPGAHSSARAATPAVP